MICDIVINEDERKKCSVLAVIDEEKKQGPRSDRRGKNEVGMRL